MPSKPAAVSALAIAALILAPLAGCSWLEPKVASPFSGKQVTEGQLAAETARYDAQRKTDEAREQAEAQAKLRRLKTDAELKASRITAEGTLTLAELKAATDASVQDLVEGLAASQRTRDAELQAMRQQLDLAAEDLEKQAAQRLAVWNAVKLIPGATAIPGFGAIEAIAGTLLLGGAGYGVGARGKGKLKTQLADTHEAAGRVVDSLDVLREKEPAVAEAFEKHKALIGEWQGELGKDLVDRLQKGKKAA